MTRRWSSPGTGTNCHQTATSANAVARRHFARHVSEPEFWPISEAETPANDSRSGDELDAHAILESSTKALTEMMESLVRQYRATAAQQPYAAERLLTTFMKVQAALARSLKQRDDDQLRREEFRKTVPQIVERCTSEAMRSILPLMRQNMTNLREEVTGPQQAPPRSPPGPRRDRAPHRPRHRAEDLRPQPAHRARPRQADPGAEG